MFNRPDMNIKCEEVLMNLIRPAQSVLEWGSGGSTVMMSKEIKLGTIYSYEHASSFYNQIKPKLLENVEYHLTPVEDYVSAPKDIHYSVILVDGIRREDCLRRAREEMSWDVLLLHDAERERYLPWMEQFDDTMYKKSFVVNLWICERI